MPVTCPTCGTTYPDGHAFCSNDGTTLRATGPITPPNASPGSSRSLVVGALGALTVVLTGLVAVLLYLQVREDALPPATAASAEPAAPEATAEEVLTATNEADPEREVPLPPADIVEPIREASPPEPAPPRETPLEPTLDYTPFGSPRRAYVQTQTDGRITLRAEPRASARRGARLTDGTQVSVVGCQTEAQVRTDSPAKGTPGRWCFVRSSGSQGWAFDAYLVYF